MELGVAVTGLAALAHESRLSVFRLLVEAGPKGLPAGQLSERLEIPPSSLSFHLKELSHAGLVHSRSQGRFVIYAADFEAINGLVGFLTENCCGGEPCVPAGGSTGIPARQGGRTKARGAGPEAPHKPGLLFLCTGNACRSQMAEGWARHLLGDAIDACSAGVIAHGLDPRAVAVMAEAGVDISGHRSKPLDEMVDLSFDHVITVCDRAAESCPILPGTARKLHHDFEDPPQLAADAGSEKQALAHYRRVRDEIRAFVETLPEILERQKK